MKGKILILLGFLFYGTIYSQRYSEKQIDSLLEVAGKLRKIKSAEALSLYQEIYTYSKKNKYSIPELKSLENIAYCNYAMGKMEKAITYATLEEKIASEKNIPQYISFALRIKAVAYSKLGFYEDADKLMQKAFVIAEKITDLDERYRTKGLLHENFIIIGLNKSNKSHDKSNPILSHLKNAAKEYSKIKSDKMREENLAEQYPSIGDEYTDLKQFDSASYYLKKGLFLSKKNNDLYNEYTSIFDFGRLAYAQEKYEDAATYFTEAAKKASIHKNPYMIRACYESLQYCYSVLNDKKKIQEYFTKYSKINDSINTVEKESVTAPFKQILKENEAEGKQQTKNLVLFTIGLISIFAIILFYLYRYVQNKKKKKKTMEMENNIKQLEYKALKAQMNPHFVFNVLNNIQSMMILKSEAEVNKYFVAFSRLLRKTLDMSNQELVSLKDEIEYINNYLILNNLQFNEELFFSITVDESIKDTEQLFVPGMIIQPFIENAIVHGLASKTDNRQLEIMFFIENDYLIATIRDNGIGREASAMTNKKRKHIYKSWSTTIVNERIKIINSTNKDSVFITIEDIDDNGVPTGTKVTLKFKV